MSSDKRLLELLEEEKLLLSESVNKPGRQDHSILASRLEDIYSQLEDMGYSTATQRYTTFTQLLTI